MGITLTLASFWETIRWLGTTVPFFSILPTFIGILVVMKMFMADLSFELPVPAPHDGEYQFDPDDFE
ncbi:hypothetical protein SAMN05421858_0582 [Haladaptatus litoreus]|uniref:Uncharacterized protein n=1 Tax=Haladaptatus litoreus TaxID=553468 RepID=A0A1N6W2U3_9EURY|nr:hypothetical protein [Haladaptatus litoreus]SIQ84441.1 hypothetical protein SAMN05421858_0582 [Haladaptatus litoreus]